MASVGKKKPRPRHSFTSEFKAGIVELCRRWDHLGGQVAKDFDLTQTAVRDRVRQAEVDNGESKGLPSSERGEPAQLRRENRRLREDVEIHERARAFFTRRPRTVQPLIEAERQAGRTPPDKPSNEEHRHRDGHGPHGVEYAGTERGGPGCRPQATHPCPTASRRRAP
ncbi:hypothetical protein ACGFZQ_41845 [Streptomyces sp. NPDC048254]|uniref:hypothetical protein n=1 Tax=Streptomyces sp. NPDC048254 TaxID=3365525 RepID=UPI00371DBDCD